jgi:transposase-like protein
VRMHLRATSACQGQSVSQVARTFNVHPATIYRCREASEGS